MTVEQRRQVALKLRLWSPKVHYPADGVAYVVCPVKYPQDVPPEIHLDEAYDAYWITLVQADDQWRIHSITLRQPTPPEALGREPYSL